MERIPRKANTYEFKQEAVRLVESGQRVAEVARSLGVVEQTLSNWIKAHKSGKLVADGRVATTDSNHKLPIAPNLLNRNFAVEKPNTTWTGDVTYIATEEGWLYLAVVIDLFSRRIVGWSMKTTIDRSLVIDALEMACLLRRPEAGKAIFHSDRGSQYASEDFREVMKMYGLIASMSRRANCWDNSVTETLFGSLKVERLHGEKFITVRAAKDAVIHWILWYNQKRMHSTIGYQSPVEFEQAWQLQREAA
jgi:putative transposase